MKILFVYLNTGSRGSYPIGLTNLATYVKAQGHDVDIFDTTFYKQFAEEGRDNIRVKVGIYKPVDNPVQTLYQQSDLMEDLLSRIKDCRPDIIGFSILSAQFHFSLGMAARLKEIYPEIPIIYGGLHPSIAPEETIRQESIDMICIGEGEYAVAELLDKMSDRKDITGIRNLWVKQNDKIYKNELRSLVDLDELPVLDWGFFSELHQNTPLNGHIYRVGPVEFSRGCPYSCNYCSCTALRNLTKPQKYLRHKSIDKAISDLLHLKKKHDINMFYFLDETFLSMNLQTLKDFSSEYRREIGIPFYGMTHPSSVTKEKVKLLEDMGCYLMTIGIEVGNEKFRKEVLNRPVANSRIVEAFDTFHHSAVFPSAFAMIGLPFETRVLVFDTIELFRRCKPETYAVGIFKPFLGSVLRKICIDKGFFDDTNDTHNYPVGTSVLNMPQFSKNEIEKLYRTFYLYTKIPLEKFPLVEQAEKDDDVLMKLIKEF